MRLTPIQQKFILHWGEMGARWGINRTVAQIHALLFISEKPLNCDEIGEALSISRSNISTSLKELQNWKLVKSTHLLGDRRDHFETHKDVWETFRIITDERKRREIDPTIELLRECVAETKTKRGNDVYTLDRLKEMLDSLETMSAWYDQIRRLPKQGLIRFLKLGANVKKFLGSDRRKTR